MTIYWFRVDDARAHWHKLCADCAERRRWTGVREEQTEGVCEACGNASEEAK